MRPGCGWQQYNLRVFASSREAGMRMALYFYGLHFSRCCPEGFVRLKNIVEKSVVSACESGIFCTFAVALFGNESEKAV